MGINDGCGSLGLCLGLGIAEALDLYLIAIKELAVCGDHKLRTGLVEVFMHKNGRLNGVTDLKHLVKRVYANDLICGGIKYVIDLLDIGFILRNDLLYTSRVGDILGSCKVDEGNKHAEKYCVKNTENDCGGLEYFASRSAHKSNGLALRRVCGACHFDVYSFCCKRYSKFGNVRFSGTSCECCAVAENVDLESYYDIARCACKSVG